MTEFGPHVWSAEHLRWLNRLSCVLVSPEVTTAEEVLSQLPSVDELVPMIQTTEGHVIIHLVGLHCANLFLVVARALEKLGCHEQALPYAQRAADPDFTVGGTAAYTTQIVALRVQGRCVAALGRPEEAARYFEASAAVAATGGMRLLEVIALAELKLLVLDKRPESSAGEEGSRRVKAAIERLLDGGGSSAAEVAELAPALPKGLDLAEVMGFWDEGSGKRKGFKVAAAKWTRD